MNEMLKFLCLLPLLASPVLAAEIRTVSGQHIVLRTDVDSSPEVDALPALFDQAFDQWCAYFDVDPAKHSTWRAEASLLRNRQSREAFIRAGLMPGDLWDFKSGYSQGKQLWLYDQTSNYYRRHLLLHEGVHCFMATILGNGGPPWYSEGMAELLGTHALVDDELQVNYFPHSVKEVPKLGRIELVRHALAEQRMLGLRQVTAFGPTAHRENEPYGWCWAATAFLDGHPRYRERFRKLPRQLGKTGPNGLTQAFSIHYRQDRALLEEEWQVYLTNLDYGYDFIRMQLDLAAGEPLPPAGATVDVAADRGWQSTGIALEAGKAYQIRARGQFQVAGEPGWVSEPGGVSIRYVHGRPLGMLLGAVRPDNFDPGKGLTPLANPQSLGLDAVLTPEQSGTLYLRINEHPGELADNSGKCRVQIVPGGEPAARRPAGD